MSGYNKNAILEAPPKEELAARYAEKGIKALAREYGVSAYTITRWLYQYDIERRESNSKRGDTIPTAVFAPILQKLLDDYRMWTLIGGTKGASRTNTGGGSNGSQIEIDGYAAKAEAIADLTKDTPLYVSSRRITAIIKNELPNVSYQVVDRLLCALHAPYMWHTDPGLREWYWEGCEKPDSWEEHVSLVEGLAAIAAGNRGDAQVAAG